MQHLIHYGTNYLTTTLEGHNLKPLEDWLLVYKPLHHQHNKEVQIHHSTALLIVIVYHSNILLADYLPHKIYVN